jgi:hypothetical protein
MMNQSRVSFANVFNTGLWALVFLAGGAGLIGTFNAGLLAHSTLLQIFYVVFIKAWPLVFIVIAWRERNRAGIAFTAGIGVIMLAFNLATPIAYVNLRNNVLRLDRLTSLYVKAEAGDARSIRELHKSAERKPGVATFLAAAATLNQDHQERRFDAALVKGIRRASGYDRCFLAIAANSGIRGRLKTHKAVNPRAQSLVRSVRNAWPCGANWQMAAAYWWKFLRQQPVSAWRQFLTGHYAIDGDVAKVQDVLASKAKRLGLI